MKFLFILSLFMFQAQALGIDQDSAASQEDVNYRLKAFIHESSSQFETNEQGQIIVNEKTLIMIEDLIDKYNITKKEFENFALALTKDLTMSGSAKDFLTLKDKDFNFNMSKGNQFFASISAGIIIGMMVALIKFASLYIVANALVPIALGAAVGIAIIGISSAFIVLLEHHVDHQAIEYLLNHDLIDNQTLIP